MPKSAVSDENCERFIELVRRNAILYDPACPEHKDAQRMYNVWASIASVMSKDHQMSALEWKKKWRGLRDTYVRKQREIRNTVSGQAAQKAQKWKYLGVLNFLDPYVEENSTQTNVPAPPTEQQDESTAEEDEDDANTSPNTSASSLFVGHTHNTSVASPQSNSPVPNTVLRSQTRLKRRNVEDSEMEHALTEMIKTNTNTRLKLQQRLIVDKTADDAFYESCAIRSKLLPDATRSFLQIQVSQLFVNAENPEMIPVPITLLPQHHHHQLNQHNQPYQHRMGDLLSSALNVSYMSDM